MLPPPLILLLFTFLIQISSSFAAAAPPLRHQSHFTKRSYHLKNDNKLSDSYKQYFEITRPLPFDTLIPSCTLPVFSKNFSNTAGLPPSTVDYSPPANCTWSNVTLHLSVASNGSQHDRIAAVWLDGAELLRTSTADPTAGGVFWNVRKDITRYSSLLRQENLTLSVMLENVVNGVYTGVYRLNLTFLYYDTENNESRTNGVNFPLSLFPLNQKSTILKRGKKPVNSTLNRDENSLHLYEKPANLIVPVSGNGDKGFWFRIENGSDVKNIGIQIPSNTYKAVIEVYVSFHGNDEFWYSNPPDSYIEMNNLNTKRGHGAYREVLVTLDDNVVGSVIPFPVIFTGGINPLFWDPIVSIGAFDLPSYDIDLTPFLGMLLDGKVHSIGLKVVDAISFWLVDANLHLWLDDNLKEVKAMAIEYSIPKFKLERELKFNQLDGSFEIEGKRESEFSGWVNSSMGNLTTYVYEELKFENTIKFNKNGTEKVVEQTVRVKRKLRVKSSTGSSISRTTVRRKYPLKITSLTLTGSAKNTYLVTTNLEHSLTEKKSDENFSSSLVNSQKSGGWMFVRDNDVLSGAATTHQSYTYKDDDSCYSLTVSAANGELRNDTTSLLCSSSL
ncbi:Peptide-N4-(N-acetyl-beta-glucosaminyl)asparagine amidase A protein [Abeliophyllum distichum]|uniref:Peptide-N4-(N-acetyl-beta-glucosaminyl)asparagine amidase A protein n=1 Tax=Abeliophyllum distichum TaxID=126358 RepID=A0ABD1UNZ4_9LAMI